MLSRKPGRTYLRNEDGVAAIMSVMMLPVMLGMAGLGVDASSWFMAQRTLQNAADAAALAAAYEVSQGNAYNAETIALREAQNNGLTDAGILEVDVGGSVDGTTSVSVSIRESKPLWFSQIFLDDVEIAVSAGSEVNEVMDGNACILSLDEEADGALTTVGNVTIDMPNCGMAVNSSSDTALQMNGSVDITVADVRVHGDYDTDGSVNFEYQSLRTGTSPVADPYADLEVPSFSACSSAEKRNGTRVNSTTALLPGVFCGGITITGNNTVTLAPGTYILDGGSFDVSGQGAIIGEGVTIILTNSPGSGDYGTVSISGGRQITLSAPDMGDTAGVVFYQDRDAPDDGTNQIVGTADIAIDGAAYFPAQELNMGGTSSGSSASNPCSRIIARTVILHGTPNISNSCDGSSARDIPMPGTNAVRLVN